MAVIDSKYEIISQEALGDGQTLFDAVAPDGTALRIIWFDLATPQQEMQFETYRQLLRRLEKQDLAAIFDIVSRPGAHYVAWYVPSNGKAKASEELGTTLTKYGYSLHNADIRSDRGKTVLYGLEFNKSVPEAEPLTPETEPPPPRYTLPRWLSVHWFLAWSLGIVLSAAGVGLWTLGFLRQANDRVITIPDLRGQDVNEASQRLHDLGLAVTTEPTASSEPLGSVVGIDPEVGSGLRPGRTVRLSYALPPGQVALTTVPQLRGEQMTSAIQTTLETAELRLGEVAYSHANVPAGIILSQTHAANTQVSKNTAVGVLVSLGPEGEQTFIPDLTGLQLEDAQYFINLAGLRTPTIDRVATSRSPTDTVLEQSIAANTLVSQRDTTLRLVVAGEDTRGFATNGVPSLIGLSLEQARQVASGYTLSVEETSTPNLPKGIIAQNPPPGGEGSSISVTVNIPPEPIPTPNAYAQVIEPKPRQVPYNFFIESGINNSEARIIARTIQGEIIILNGRSISGNQWLSGSWETTIPGPITFTLLLNGNPYAEQQQNP
jgi:eukaryotic-like serine/threonine-protein kinase